MTDASSTVRTYAVGDEVERGDYAYAQNNTTWCMHPIEPGGWVCSVKEGHDGPQHVAVGGGIVRAVADRDTSGDEPVRYTIGSYAPKSLRREEGTPSCLASLNGGYSCNRPAGHDGQHLAIGGDTGYVYAEQDQIVEVPPAVSEDNTLTLLDGRRVQVPAELYPTVRDEQHAYTVQLDGLRRQLEGTRATLNSLQVEHDTFREQVRDTATDYAKRHGWCSVVDEALEAMGLEPRKRTYRVSTKIVVEQYVDVLIDSTDEQEAWRAVDRWDSDELRDGLRRAGVSLTAYERDGWEYSSHDASTTGVSLEDED